MIAAIAACIAGLTLTLAPSLIIVTAAFAIEASGILVAHACAGSRVSAAGMYICSYYICGTVGGVLPGLFWKYGGWPRCVGPGHRGPVRCRFLRGVRMRPANRCTGPHPAVACVRTYQCKNESRRACLELVELGRLNLALDAVPQALTYLFEVFSSNLPTKSSS
jgi:hypothetical protein